MAINTMRPAHNAKVLLSERRVSLSGHFVSIIVKPSHVPHPAACPRFDQYLSVDLHEAGPTVPHRGWRSEAMPSDREKREHDTLSSLFDTLSNRGPGDFEHWVASAELERRRFVAQEALEQVQRDAINAQIEATEYAKQSLAAMRNTAFWTAVAAVGTAVAALATFVSSLGAWFHR